MRTYFFLILVPPTYLALRILIRGKGPVWRRVLAVPFLYLVSQVYTINSTFFSSLAGPDIPAWLLLLQIWLFMALIILFLCTVVLDAISLVRRLHIRLFSKRKAAAPPSVPDDTALASRRAFLKGGVQSAACLLGAQIGWEMLLQYPYVRTFFTSFVSLEQVFCAVFFMVILVVGCRKTKKWRTIPMALGLMGVSAFFQFFRDNKIEIEWEWALDNAWTIALVAFVLVSAGLIVVGLKAVDGKK